MNNINNKFILIEGLDGTGKSSIIQGLKDRLRFVSVHSPGSSYDKNKEYVQKCDEFTQFFYYMGANFDISQKIKSIMDTGNSVICDKYFPTTISALSFYSGISIQSLKKMTDEFIRQLVFPSVVLYIYVSPEIRCQRIINRKSESNNKTDNLFIKNKESQIVAESILQDYIRLTFDKYFFINAEEDINTVIHKIEDVLHNGFS